MYTTTQHNPMNWRNWVQQVRENPTQAHEVSEEIAHYFGCDGGIPAHHDLDENTRVRIWRSPDHKYWVQAR